MSRFCLKTNDRLPWFRAKLKDGRGQPIDLTGATSVLFRMRPVGGSTLKVNAAASVVAPATAGIVEYQWAAGDSDTPGEFDAEFAVTFPTGVQTVPSSGFARVVVSDDLA